MANTGPRALRQLNGWPGISHHRTGQDDSRAPAGPQGKVTLQGQGHKDSSGAAAQGQAWSGAQTHTVPRVLVSTWMRARARSHMTRVHTQCACTHADTHPPQQGQSLLTWKASEQTPHPSQQVPLGKELELWREEGRGQRPAKPHWPAILWKLSSSRMSSCLPAQEDVQGGG